MSFVSNVNRFYDWWREQSLKRLLKQVNAGTMAPEQRLESLLKEYESCVTLNFPESTKSHLACSPTFRVTVLRHPGLAF